MRVRCALALALAGAALSPAAAQAAEPPPTSFDYEVVPRVDGPAQPTREYVRPRSWDVILDACPDGQATVPPDAPKFVWSVPAEPVDRRVTTTDKPLRAACRFRMSVHAQGVYPVTLRRRAADGALSAPVTRDVTVIDRLVVALGDSIASGEGNPDVRQKFNFLGFKSENARWQSRQCHRSARHAPMAIAARALERADRHSAVTFVNLACSGAGIERSADGADGGLLDPYAGIERGRELLPQLDQLAALVRSRPVDALVISIGANDLRFTDVVKQCFKGSCATARLRDKVNDRLNALRDRYRRLAERLQALRVPPERVYLTEYPDPTTDERGRRVRLSGILGHGIPGIPLPLGIDAREVAFAAEAIVGPLNRLAREAAAAHGWRFVGGIAQAFVGHGYAAGRESHIRSAEQSIERQGPWPVTCNRLNFLSRNFVGPCGKGLVAAVSLSKGTLHPSEPGTETIARIIRARLSFPPADDPARSVRAAEIDGPARLEAGPGTARTVTGAFSVYPQNLRSPLTVRWTVDGAVVAATGERADLTFALPVSAGTRKARVEARITDADGRVASAERSVTITKLDRPDKVLPQDDPRGDRPPREAGGGPR
jgi:hypothetical protein